MSAFTIAREQDANLTIKGAATKIVNGVEVILNLDTETSAIELLYRKPEKSTGVVTATITNPGSGDGLFHYDTTGTFFAGQKRGYWHFQLST